MSTRKQEMAAASRRKLLEAAIQLFAERGYRETSLQDIALEAGISRGSVAWHFGSKAGLLAAAVEAVVEEWLARVADEADQSMSTLEGWIERYRRTIERSKIAELFPMLLLEAIRPGTEIRAEYAELYRRLRASLARRVIAAQDTGDLPPHLDADATATALWGALIGIHLQWRLDPHRVDFNTALRNLAILAHHSRAP